VAERTKFDRFKRAAMKLHPKQIESVLALEGPKRYEHFIKRVADSQRVWGLYNDGWALAEANEDGVRVFPLWPDEDYAEMCAKDEWSEFEPKPIPLDEFLDEVLPGMEEDRIIPGVFWKPDGNAVTPTPAQLAAHLQEELEEY